MAFKVAISKSVLQEYDDAMRYIATEYGSPRVMKNLASEYDAAVAALEMNPLAYPIDWGVSADVAHEIRKIRVKNYLMRYEVDEGSCMVKVYSLLHERQDASRRFPVDFEAEF